MAALGGGGGAAAEMGRLEGLGLPGGPTAP